VSALRAGLLAGRAVALAGTGSSSLPMALRALGAETHALSDGVLADEDGAAAWAAARAPLTAAVIDAAPAFGAGGAVPLRGALECAWRAARAAATGAMIGADAPGKLVFIGPPPAAGPYAAAARDGLENLARTLSVEWARYAITTAAIAPGDATTAEELGQLVGFLVSPAGAFISGCRLDLGLVAAPAVSRT
jgi:NAD(P)-dependent dehydrogenase (short-subunit alcohol dehydrogenase family)